jgi:hypothetical protein
MVRQAHRHHRPPITATFSEPKLGTRTKAAPSGFSVR